MVSEEESAIILVSFPLEHFPPLGFFQDLFFIFGYLQFEYDVPNVVTVYLASIYVA